MVLAQVLFFCVSTAAGQVGEGAATPPASVDPRPEAPQGLRQEVEALRERIAKLEQEAALGSSDEGTNVESLQFQPSLRWYGFFDLSLVKVDIPAGSLAGAYAPDKASFTQTSINLYTASRLTERLRVLLEFRFSFMPNGMEKVGAQYERVSTEFRQPFLGLTFRHGSITAERAHLSFAFTEWLELTAGRFLTPVGIWNVDHGSTVILPMRQPQFLWNEMIPLSQTGLQLSGHFFLGRKLSVDYALTVSNGRGPADASFDVDENKAVGMRAQLSYEQAAWTLSLGGTGYYGESSNPTKRLDLTGSKPRIETNWTFDKFETCLAADLLFQGFGLRLQGEFMWRRQDFTKPAPASPLVLLERIGTPVSAVPYFMPNSNATSYYALAAYDLPFHLGYGVRLTPYVLYDYYEETDLSKMDTFKTLAGGLNLGLSPYTVLKLEYSRFLLHELAGGAVNFYQSQLAISF